MYLGLLGEQKGGPFQDNSLELLWSFLLIVEPCCRLKKERNGCREQIKTIGRQCQNLSYTKSNFVKRQVTEGHWQKLSAKLDGVTRI
jgi:hypothetical protein